MNFNGIDLLSNEFLSNPHPMLAMLRESGPVMPFDERINVLVTRYDDCDTILRDKRLGREVLTVMTEEEKAALPPANETFAPVAKLQRGFMLFRDPPNHSRLRGLVAKAFTPRMISKLDEQIQHIADDLIDQIIEKGEMEAIADFALPLPVTVIAELLGVPEEERGNFNHRAGQLVGANDLVPATPEQIKIVVEATTEIADYVGDLIARKRANPDDRLLSALIRIEEEGDKLTEDELVATALLVLTAGYETTTNLIGNGLKTLLEHPDQWEMLKANPDLTPSAVQEILRYEPPITLTGRYALQDFEIQGIPVKRLKQVGIMLITANRDPRKYTDPDTFDITRAEVTPMTFGGGIHYCLGAPLAKLEGDIAFRTLARRLPDMKLSTDTFDWRKLFVLRGLERLPIALQ